MSNVNMACLNPTERINFEKAKELADEGYSLYIEQDFDNALICFAEAIRIYPQLAETYLYQGLVHTCINEYEKAIADFTQAITVGNIREAYFNRGDIYIATGNFDAAIANFSDLIQYDPQFAEAYLERGAASKLKKDYESANEDFVQAVGLNRNLARVACAYRGDIFMETGEYANALDYYDRAIASCLKDPLVFYSRGLAHQLTGYEDEALADFTQAIQRDPEFMEAYLNRACLYELRGELDRARADFKKGNELRRLLQPERLSIQHYSTNSMAD